MKTVTLENLAEHLPSSKPRLEWKETTQEKGPPVFVIEVKGEAVGLVFYVPKDDRWRIGYVDRDGGENLPKDEYPTLEGAQLAVERLLQVAGQTRWDVLLGDEII